MPEKITIRFHTALLVSFLVFLCGKVTNAQHADFNSANIYQKLNALNTFGSILYIGVTPADKNIPLLNYFSRQKNYRTGFISLTRGENLKNKYGTEDGFELGLIHVAEGIQQYKFDGIENFYTTAYDAGTSGNEEQLYRGWDTLKILSDIVWIIRNFKPDIIITPFSSNDTTLNAEQKITASLIQSAFIMAADAAAFTDQLAYGATRWKTLRLFCDNSNNENNNNNITSINTNTFNALTGQTTTEIANASLQYQKSIYGNNYTIDAAGIQLKLLAGDNTFTDIMDGVEQNHLYLNDTIINLLQPLVKNIIAGYNFPEPEQSVTHLVKLYETLLNANSNNNWKSRKLNEIQNLILLCSGISLKAYSNQPFAVPGDSLNVQLSVNKRSPVDVQLSEIIYPGYDVQKTNLAIPFLTDTVFNRMVVVNKNKEATQPYWLRNSAGSEYMYNVNDQYLIGEDEDEPDYKLSALLKIDTTYLDVTMPVEYVAAKGNGANKPSQNVFTNLPVIVSLSPNIILTNVKPGNDFTNNLQIAVKFRSNISRDSVKLKLKIYEPGFTIAAGDETVKQVPRKTVFETDSIMNLYAGESYSINIPLNDLDLNKDSAATLNVIINANINGTENAYSSTLKTIRYEYLPDITYFYSDRTKIIPDEIKTTGGEIGYLSGGSDWIPYSLKQLGYKVKLLTAGDFYADSLNKLAAIVISPYMQDVQHALMNKYDSMVAYVNKGGKLVFLNSRNEMNLNGPFKLVSTSLKLPSLNSEITFTQQAPGLFLFPNKIETTDFRLWQSNLTEFAFYTDDTGFQMPLSINYDNKYTANNSIAIKKYGKGYFIFSGLSLPSQLSSGVASAYKLLPNMITFSENQSGAF
ncbi:hypothetical protein [Parafilimonas sp.]|uniref:hypothetical protein n=1 Tax=Parafilimonas sp. TaxID=1969739 RepID=UPI0039E4BFA0